MMTQTVKQDRSLDINGTSLQGYLECHYQKLVEVLGEPVLFEDGKSDAEWVLQTPVGVATLYNYKNGKNYMGKYGLKTENITDWHIGGKSNNVVQYVQEAVA